VRIIWSCCPSSGAKINAYGIRIDCRTYDCVELGPWRLQHSGVTARRWVCGKCHYDPYDAPHVFVRTPDGWVTVPWTHLPMCVGAARGVHLGATPAPWPREKAWTTPTRPRFARVLDDLLTRAQAGPVSKLSDRIAARTRVAGAAHRHHQEKLVSCASIQGISWPSDPGQRRLDYAVVDGGDVIGRPASDGWAGIAYLYSPRGWALRLIRISNASERAIPGTA